MGDRLKQGITGRRLVDSVDVGEMILHSADHEFHHTVTALITQDEK